MLVYLSHFCPTLDIITSVFNGAIDEGPIKAKATETKNPRAVYFEDLSKDEATPLWLRCTKSTLKRVAFLRDSLCKGIVYHSYEGNY